MSVRDYIRTVCFYSQTLSLLYYVGKLVKLSVRAVICTCLNGLLTPTNLDSPLYQTQEMY